MTDSNGDLVERMTKILQRSDPLAGHLVARAAIAAVLDDIEAAARNRPEQFDDKAMGAILVMLSDLRDVYGLASPTEPGDAPNAPEGATKPGNA